MNSRTTILVNAVSKEDRKSIKYKRELESILNTILINGEIYRAIEKKKILRLYQKL